MQIKNIDLTKGFEANGKKYTFSNSICTGRYAEYEKLQATVGYGADFKTIFDNLRELYALINEMRFADASVQCHNIMKNVGEASDDTRIHPALMLCTLILNYEGEDVTAYNEQVCREKIEDWTKEGIDVQCFFSLALNSIHGFRASYELVIQDIFSKPAMFPGKIEGGLK